MIGPCLEVLRNVSGLGGRVGGGAGVGCGVGVVEGGYDGA